MPTSLSHLARAVAIARTLARHDALEVLAPLPGAALVTPLMRWLAPGARQRAGGKRPGEKLVTALTELGPSFIKLGQALSVRSDLVGEAMAADLATLQDRLPPFDGAEARKTVERELGQPLEAVFARFDDEPIAAASIAQVHTAETGEGDKVVVKVLRPGIEAAFARDLAFFAWGAAQVERYRPALRRLKPVACVETFAATVEQEMDLRFEAAAAEELARNFADDPAFRVPVMDWQRTGQRVLTMERIAGTPIDEREALIEAGHDPATIVAAMARVLFLQVFRDGFFHADLHPGNLFVAGDGAVVAVDFGIMGRIDRRTRFYLAEMLAGFLSGDYARVASVHFRAGYVPADQSEPAFAQAARSIAEPILGRNLADISLAQLLAQLFRVTERFKMETQPQLLLLQKTMLVAEGVGRQLHPEANMWDLSRPLIEEWVAENMTPEAQAVEAASEMARGLARLPALVASLGESAGAIAGGRVRLHPESVRSLAEAQKSAGVRWPLWLTVGLLAVLVVAAI